MDEIRITKAQAKEMLGFETDAQLAYFFSVTKQAVSFWPEHGSLPVGRAWQLRAMRPELFKRRKAA